MTAVLGVRFAGDPGGTAGAGSTAGTGAGWEGPATWGQRALWDGMRRYQRQRWCRNTVSVRGVEAGESVDGVLAGIGELVSRHEALRTEFWVAGGELRQRVHASGEVELGFEEAGDHGAALVATLARELPTRALDAPGRLPVSFTVVTEHGAPRYVVTALCFQNADGPSVRVLLDGSAAPPLQPREQHAQERRDAAARRSDRAIAHWLAECAKAEIPFRRRPAAATGTATSPVTSPATGTATSPATSPATGTATSPATGTATGTATSPATSPATGTATSPATGAGARVAQAALTSAAAAARAEDVARRTGTTSSAVLTTAVAVAVSAVTGRHAVPLQPFVSNRHLPGTAGYVGFLAQLCATTAELDPRSTFADTVPRVQRGCLRAYRNAWWSPPGLDAALDAAGLVPDDVLGATCTVNDLRGPWPGTHAVPPDPGHDHALRELPWWPYQGGRCAVAFTGGPELLTVALRLDTAYLPAELLPRLLRAVDGVLRAAGADPGAAVAELLARAAGHLAGGAATSGTLTAEPPCTTESATTLREEVSC